MKQQPTITLNTQRKDHFRLELPVGTIIDIDDEIYEVIASNKQEDCRKNCAFYHDVAHCELFPCIPATRSDYQFIHFLKKD